MSFITSRPRPRHLIGIFAALSVITLASAPAWSLVAPGIAGRAYASPSCFVSQSQFAGAAYNICSGGDVTATQRTFTVPLHTANNTFFTFSGRIAGNGTNPTVCRGVVVGPQDGITTLSPPLSVTGVPFQLVSTPVVIFIPSDSTAQFECDVAQSFSPGFRGGGVLSVGE